MTLKCDEPLSNVAFKFELRRYIKVSLWYAEHSTATPKVPLPEGVTLIEGNKFSAYHTV